MHFVLGKLAIKPELRDAFLAYARSTLLVERATPGNVSFDFYADIAVENGYLMIERWIDVGALDVYTQTATYHEHEAALTAFLSGEPVWDEYEF